MPNLPISVKHRIHECQMEHNFGCWGRLFQANFQNENQQVNTIICCEAHRNNPRLTQGNNVNFGTKLTEWVVI